MNKISDRASHLKQSGIRNASTRCAALGGINLGQGICNIPTPEPIKQEAYHAIANNKNIYSACEGVMSLRVALAEKIATFNHVKVDPETQVLITHGSTGAFVSAAMTLFNPGDEVILFEPFYGYHKNILALQNINVKAVPINLDDFSIDFDQLRAAVGPRTRAIVICTPNNPSGKVYSRAELLAIGEIARQHDLYLITDEIYEYITYQGHEHFSIASLEDFADRTITISGFSKTYNMTGWRLGYASGPAEIIKKMALVQDLLYVCPATPLQYAGLAALKLPESYYQDMRTSYVAKRDLTVAALRSMGFKVTVPEGAYYILADFSALPFKNDEEAADQILQKAKVASVPGGSFYDKVENGRHIVRICYALDQQQITQALRQMQEMMDVAAV